MNRAIAVAETDGPEAGLVLLDQLADDLDRYHLLHASRGAMLERLGRPDEAAAAYERAATLARTERRRVLPRTAAPRTHRRCRASPRCL